MNRLKKKLLYAGARRALVCMLQSKAGFIGTGMAAGLALGALAGAVVWRVKQ